MPRPCQPGRCPVMLQAFARRAYQGSDRRQHRDLIDRRDIAIGERTLEFGQRASQAFAAGQACDLAGDPTESGLDLELEIRVRRFVKCWRRSCAGAGLLSYLVGFVLDLGQSPRIG